MSESTGSTSSDGLSTTYRLKELLDIPGDGRSELWERQFRILLPDAWLKVATPQIVTDQNGLEYVSLAAPGIGEAFSPYSVASMLKDAISGGLGILVCDSPDEEGEGNYAAVIPYGDLVHLYLTGSLNYDGDSHDAGAFEPGITSAAARESQTYHPVPEDYLPAVVRRVLRRYLALNRVENATISLVSRINTQTGERGRAVAIGLNLLSFDTPDAYERCVQMLHQLLPRNYCLLPVNDGSASGFEPL